mgnify:CR=1 FL=1
MKRFLLVLSVVLAVYSNLNAQNLIFNKIVLPTSSPYFSFTCFYIYNYVLLLQEDGNHSLIFISSDNGLNWYNANKEIYYFNYAFTLNKNDRVYSIGLNSLYSEYDSLKDAIIYSDDYCKTWKKLCDFNFKSDSRFTGHHNDLNNLFIELDSVVLRYDIQNRIFDTVLVFDNKQGYFFINPYNNYYYSIFYKKLDLKFLLSKDYGAKWDTVKVKTPLGKNWDFMGAYDTYMHSMGQVFHSTDGGEKWESIYEADLEDDINDLEFWGTNMVFAKEKSIVYSKEPYTDFTETDMSSLVNREINYIRISKDGHLFVRADDTLLYSADLKEAGLGITENPISTNEGQLAITFTRDKAIIESATGIIGNITISDICGRSVYWETCPGARREIQLGGLPAGVYFVMVVTNEGNLRTEKFLRY